MTKDLVRWSDNLSTGINWQDAQHKELLQNMYALYYALLEGRIQEGLANLLPFLDEYVEKHFGQEARAMHQYAFEETVPHLEQHTLFLTQLSDIKQQLAESAGSTNFSIAASLCMELNNWFIKHIGSFDQRLGAFLKQQ